MTFRRDMKNHNTFIMRLLIFFVVVIFGIGGVYLWWNEAVSSVDPSDSAPVIFVVKKGEGIRSISARLAQQNLIRSSTGFYLTVKALGIERDIQAGDYRLNKSMDAAALARELTHGILDTWVTTLEGWRVEEIATKLAKELNIPESEFLKYAKEGYMFPDTYLIPTEATPAGVSQLFQDTFDKKMTPQMRSELTKTGLTLDQAIVLASIVEREGVSDADRPVIAGILLKRLKSKWPLQTDATIQYVLGYQADEKTWWKKALTREDLQVKSPYNTYLNQGLPPGPIANPGLSAIKAVINARETDYWYYLHDPKGDVHFGKTVEEHNMNISRYLQ